MYEYVYEYEYSKYVYTRTKISTNLKFEDTGQNVRTNFMSSLSLWQARALYPLYTL